MADRSRGGLRALVASVLAVLLAVLLAGCAAAPAGADPAASAPATPLPAVDAPVRMLQLNVCNSGYAGCYTGRAVPAAAAVLRAETPDAVTLNEVCRDDVFALRQVLAEAVGDTGTAVVAAFQPAWNATTDGEYRCRNGQGYGVGVLSRLPSAAVASRGIYPAQDPDDPERRAWLCLGGAATVCTTHLAHIRRDVALAQCRHLMSVVVPGLRAGDVPAPLVLGADLNLGAGDTPDLRSCLPAAIGSVGDGGLQHVVVTSELVAGEVRRIDLRGVTDHPGLLVVLTPAGNDRARQARVTHR